jgi:hypothetical protein
MEHPPDRTQQSRESILTVALVLLVGGLMLFFLYLVSMGIVGNVLAAGAIFLVVGALHYLVWGRRFSQEVANESEAARRKETQERLAPPEPWQEASDAIQDLSHGQIKKRKDA